MDSFLSSISEEPTDLLYVGIGSCPHVGDHEALTPHCDQLIPLWFHERILQEKKSLRILHIDPAFDEKKAFLDRYFERWNVVAIEVDEGWRWISDTLDIRVLASSINHDEDYPFFKRLCDCVLDTKGKLIVQEYTGYELNTLNQRLYSASSQQEKFKRRILIDMTYGLNCDCCTDMTKARPLLDSRGHFLNLHFATDADAKHWVGSSAAMDEFLRRKYRALYLQTLNRMHVDYRLKLTTDRLLYGSPSYSESSTPDEIMAVLHDTLQPCVDILVRVGGIRSSNKAVFQELFHTYKAHDPYKWYSLIQDLVENPDSK